jgi:non-ribosomal peptide synthetase-like protein
MANIVLRPDDARGIAVWWRMGCTVVTICVVQGAVCGLAVLPVVLLWLHLGDWIPTSGTRAAVISVLVMPSYLLFALCLMGCSALVTRAVGARAPAGAEMRIGDMRWPLLRWAHYMVATHLVRLCAGNVFRGSPIWTLYLRLNGARIGRRVYVNSLDVSDHNLLECGDDVVIGADVHLSGHTVESGVVKTGAVRIGSGVAIGLGSVVDIGVEVGDWCQLGALSLVPKFSRLEAGAVYAGVPARRIDRAGADHTTRGVSRCGDLGEAE